MEIQITDQALLRLAADQRVRAQAPIFARLFGASRRRGCGKCRKRQQGSQAQILQAIKSMLLTNRKLRDVVKRSVGARTLAVHARVGTKIERRVV